MGMRVKPFLLLPCCRGLMGLSAKPLSSPVKIIPFGSPTLKE